MSVLGVYRDVSMCYYMCFFIVYMGSDFFLVFFFFFNDTATTEIYTLSLHDALPIFPIKLHEGMMHRELSSKIFKNLSSPGIKSRAIGFRSEEHTSELQSPCNLVCRLLLEKKKKINNNFLHTTIKYTLINSLKISYSSTATHS